MNLLNKKDYKLYSNFLNTLAKDLNKFYFSKLNKNLNWKPEANFEQGIDLTVRWYLDNIKWMKDITSGNYQTYYEKMYGGIL